jgi:hypothetical protein
MQGLHLNSSKSRRYGCTCETQAQVGLGVSVSAPLWFELTDLGRMGANLEADHGSSATICQVSGRRGLIQAQATVTIVALRCFWRC